MIDPIFKFLIEAYIFAYYDVWLPFYASGAVQFAIKHSSFPIIVLVVALLTWLGSRKSHMMQAFFRNPEQRWWAWGGGFVLLLSMYIQVQFSVYINDWYGSFYNMLQNPKQHTISEFWAGIRQFLIITVPWALLWAFTSYCTSRYALQWREMITRDYLLRCCNVPVKIEGESQRIQEDAQKFARIVESLGLQVARALMTLIAFLPVLWTLSANVDIPFIPGEEMVRTIGDNKVTINYVPGALVWFALLTSGGGTLIAWFVGNKLPGLEFNNQRAEAAFRKELVHAEDNRHMYNDFPSLFELFVGVRVNYLQLYLHYGYLNVYVAFYDQLMSVAAYAIAGPGIFTGAILLGTLVQVSNAFSKVHGCFSLFLYNWTTITELRSIWMRLKQFEENLDKYHLAKATV